MKINNTILGLLVIFFITSCNDITVVDTFAKDKNIYVTKTDGKIEQVTYTGKDINSLISPDKNVVYFIRQTGNFGEYEYEGVEQLAIMQVDLKSLKEEKLTDTVYYEDRKSTAKIHQVEGFALSQDGRFILFVAQKWSTSGVLVRIDTKTRKMTELTHGDSFELLKDGKYKNHIIVNRSSIKTNASREWSNWLMDIDGKVIKEIGDDDNVTNFKLKQIL